MRFSKVIEDSSVGARIRELRKAIGLSRKYISEKHKIPQISLQSWEDNKRCPSPDNVKALCNVFSNYNIFCTPEWIISGHGSHPLKEKDSFYEDQIIFHEIRRFEEFYKDSKVLQATDNLMAPFISQGDYVGGIKISNNDFSEEIGDICIVNVKDFGTMLRIVGKGTSEEFFNLLTISKENEILNVKIKELWKVVWIRKFSLN